ncbi:hypothetical protein QZH41_003957 [Actinostola sp. cb2023]|nr:hypothetical protein QZH41_003957 [Actinostola sp. cb2023]
MSVHHSTGSKQIATLLNRMGYCSSYDELKSVDTSLASEVLAKSEEYGTVLLSNISLGSFVQIAADNNDFNEETLDEGPLKQFYVIDCIGLPVTKLLVPVERVIRTMATKNNKRFNVGTYMKAKRDILKEVAVEKARQLSSIKYQQEKIRRLKEKDSMNVDGEYVPPFCIRDGKTFIRRKRGIMELLGDFTLTIVGEAQSDGTGCACPRRHCRKTYLSTTRTENIE